MTMDSVPHTISFIGAGAMAEAILSGWFAMGMVKPDQVCACDPSEGRREIFRKMGATVYENAGLMCKAHQPDILIVATKPQYVEQALTDVAMVALQGKGLSKTLIVSIAAGKSTDSLIKALNNNDLRNLRGARVVRVMPNTPCMVGEAASALSRGGLATDADCALVKTLFGAVGLIEEVPENIMSAVTGLSGSGPAYVYIIIEALADAGVRHGLPRATALRLAAQTVVGAGRMVLEKGHPAVLKDLVASPGGTTIAGVHSLENSGVRAAMMNAVTAAAEKSEDLRWVHAARMPEGPDSTLKVVRKALVQTAAAVSGGRVGTGAK